METKFVKLTHPDNDAVIAVRADMVVMVEDCGMGTLVSIGSDSFICKESVDEVLGYLAEK